MKTMKILSQKREGNKVFLEIEESYARFLETFDRTLAEAGKEVKIAGFRPGKAPKEMIEKALDRDYVEHRAAQTLIAEIYPQILELAALEPVEYPSIEITQLENGKPLLFKAVVEVYPAVKLGKYKGLKVEKKSAEVSDEELTQLMGRLQERFTATNALGEKTVLPLDDEFAKKVSKYGTLGELQAEIRLATEREKAAEVETDIRDQLLNAIMAVTETEVPSALVDREIEIMLDELQVSLSQSGIPLEDYLRGAKKTESELRKDLRQSAEKRIKGKVALRAIAETEQLQVSEEEIKAEIKLALGGAEPPAGQKPQVTPELIKYLKEYLLRKKAMDLLLEKAIVKEAKT
jgi:FKBP-type peptidyl-prolyl cis-trans isomerase (trigger factor)